MSFLTLTIYDDAREGQAPFCLPSVQQLAKYFNDPFPIFRDSARLLLSTTLQQMTLRELELLFDEWYGCLPSLKTPGRKAMARACVILGGLVLHESQVGGVSNAVILGINSPRLDDMSAPRCPVALSPQSKQQLVLSVISLLISSASEDGSIYNLDKTIIMHRSIAVDFIGNLWSQWESVLTTLR